MSTAVSNPPVPFVRIAQRCGVPCFRLLATSFIFLFSFVPPPLALAASPPFESGSLLPPDAQAAFDAGLEAFDRAQSAFAAHPADRDAWEARYREAGAHFLEAWKAGAATTEVFTNAGNAFAFAGALGEAVLAYRRALAIDPGNAGARSSLEYLRSKLPIRPAAGGAVASILKTLFFWHEGLAFRLRFLLFAIFYPAAFGAFALAAWRRSPFRALGLLALVLGTAFLGSILVDAASAPLATEAVIQVDIEGRRGDGLNYSASHSKPLPAGTELTILEERETGGSREAWLRVRLLDGRESWIPRGVVERILP